MAQTTVDPSWQRFFEGFEFARSHWEDPAENGNGSAATSEVGELAGVAGGA